MASPVPFRIGLTDDGVYDKVMAIPTALQALEHATGAVFDRFPVDVDPIPPETLDAFDAVLSGGSYYTRKSTAGVNRCSLIVRFGAGYDRVDLDACTDAGIIVATTPEGVRRPMAVAALTHLLVLSTRFIHRSRLVYSGRWDESQNVDQIGMGLTGRTLGLVGFGSIGRDLHSLVRPLAMRHLVYDPYLPESVELEPDVERVDLDTLLTQADIVVILCALTAETRHLIGEKQLNRMKPTAYLVNIARGPIVDQKALTRALLEGRIRGAGLDVMDPEPIAPDDPLLKLDNVHLTPHALGLTDEMLRLCSERCVRAALDVMTGNPPASVINRAVLDHPALKKKLDAYRKYHSAPRS